MKYIKEKAQRIRKAIGKFLCKVTLHSWEYAKTANATVWQRFFDVTCFYRRCRRPGCGEHQSRDDYHDY